MRQKTAVQFFEKYAHGHILKVGHKCPIFRNRRRHRFCRKKAIVSADTMALDHGFFVLIKQSCTVAYKHKELCKNKCNDGHKLDKNVD